MYRDSERAVGADKEKFEDPRAHAACLGMRHANYGKLDADGCIAVGEHVQVCVVFWLFNTVRVGTCSLERP